MTSSTRTAATDAVLDSGGWSPSSVTRLLAIGIVALSAVGGWFYWDRVQPRGEQTARDVFPKLAAKQIPKVFGYDYQTVERSLNEVYPLLTPEYRQEFEDRANKDIIPQARERQSSARPMLSVRESLCATKFGIGDGVHEPYGDR